MKNKPDITIHYGAVNDDITVDAQTFVRHKMSRAALTQLRRIIVGALEKIGHFVTSGGRQ